jgi:hypothetical protein
MNDLPCRVQMDMEEAVDRVAHFYRDGRPLTAWEVLGVTHHSTRDEILAAYTRLCDEHEAHLASPDLHVAIGAEEHIRDYTAALMVLAAD